MSWWEFRGFWGDFAKVSNREYNEKNTVANMHYLCVNSKSADSYPSSTRDFLYWVKRGIFEIYSPEKHDGATRQDDSLPNNLADFEHLVG